MKIKAKLKKLQGILWSINASHLNLEKNKSYIINQVLMYGDLEDIKWLKETYSLKTVKQVFLYKPQKIYTPQALNFISKFLLNIKKINPQNYLKTTPRYT